MIRFLGSGNNKYQLGIKDRKLTLYSCEAKVWEYDLTDDRFDINGPGNNGLTLITTRKKAFMIMPEKNSSGMKITSIEALLLKDESDDEILDASLNGEGTYISICRLKEKSGINEKILKAFSLAPNKNTLKECEILIYDLHENKKFSVFKIDLPDFAWSSFKCSVSRNFNYFTISNIRKTNEDIFAKQILMSFDGKKLKTVQVHEINTRRIKKMIVDDEGKMMLEYEQAGNNYVVVIEQNGMVHSINPPGYSEVIHIGNQFTAFWVPEHMKLIAKTFANKEICNESFMYLEEIGVEFGFFFDVRDGINIIHFRDGKININRAELSTVNLEKKRCELAKQKKIVLSDMPVDVEYLNQNDEDDFYKLINDRKKSDNSENKRKYDKDELIGIAEDLRTELIMGNINENEYQKRQEIIQEMIEANDMEEFQI